jgi:hypothetical protein
MASSPFQKAVTPGLAIPVFESLASLRHSLHLPKKQIHDHGMVDLRVCHFATAGVDAFAE